MNDSDQDRTSSRKQVPFNSIGIGEYFTLYELEVAAYLKIEPIRITDGFVANAVDSQDDTHIFVPWSTNVYRLEGYTETKDK